MRSTRHTILRIAAPADVRCANQDLFVMYTRGRSKSIYHFRP